MKTVCIWTFAIILVLLVVFGLQCLSALIFMLLWNWLLPLFGVTTLTFWQSFGATLLLGFIGMEAFNKTDSLAKLKKEDLKRLKKTSCSNEISQEETDSIPVEVKVLVEVEHPDEDKIKVTATANDIPLTQVSPTEVAEKTSSNTPVGEEITTERPVKKSSRRRKPKKANNNSDSPTL